MGLDQALPKRGPVPNNVARVYDGPPGPALKAVLQQPHCVHRICSLLLRIDMDRLYTFIAFFVFSMFLHR